MNAGKNIPVILYTFILDISKNGLKLDFHEISFQRCCNNFLLLKQEMSIIINQLQDDLTFLHTQTFQDEVDTKCVKCNRKDSFMASIDLKDASYSILVAARHRKYLTFFETNEHRQFKFMPNRYGTTMRIFIKITEVPFSVLRMQGHS